ncbi:MAG TPA: histidine--tRNA ligase [Candidatus Paceibacterota bacterium]|nr:histidine--tRNA ligase [Candidatus Paceibacterota bacterium]
MKKIDTDAYKGVRDFYPEDMFIQDYIFSVWHSVLQSYGYEHYSSSILEHSEIYEGKTSSEIVNEQTYTFVDRGNRRVTLRPEMTPSITRMVAKKQKTLPFPLKWYSIPNVFRYERPQKGRLREHWQLNVDIFGIDSIYAELELIDISYQIMHKFGLQESDFVIKINDRKIIEDLMINLKLSEEQKAKFKKLLDKKDKVSDFNQKMIEVIGRPLNETISPNKNIQNLIEKLNSRNIRNVVFDPMLIRGFDYYTGIVFEIFDTNPQNNRSLFGGGRYNDLLDIFGGKKIGTVGFGMGDVTIRDALEIRNLLPKKISAAHAFVCTINESNYDAGTNIANELRANGVDVFVNYEDKKISDQIRKAEKKGIPYVIFVGDEEVKSGKFKIKNIISGSENNLSIEQMIAFLKEKLSN